MKSKKVFAEFSKDKHVITLDPRLLANADQKGGVVIATDTGYYRLEKLELQPQQDALAGEAEAEAQAQAEGEWRYQQDADAQAEYEFEQGPEGEF